jgi:hypothetical protein
MDRLAKIAAALVEEAAETEPEALAEAAPEIRRKSEQILSILAREVARRTVTPSPRRLLPVRRPAGRRRRTSRTSRGSPAREDDDPDLDAALLARIRRALEAE